MKMQILAFLWVAACAHEETRSGGAAKADCEFVKGKMPPPVKGAANVRGVLNVAPAILGQTVYIGLDYSTQDGTRQVQLVGRLTPNEQETRFRCVAPTSSQVAFWKFVFLSHPQDDCGYFAEMWQPHELEVELKCRPEFRQSWDTYRDSLQLDSLPDAPSSGPEESVPLPDSL